MGSRRGHGEGSIFQRASDGKWVALVDLGYVDGKRKRKPIYGVSRKEVAEKLKAVLRDQQQGLPIALERQTVEQFITRWLEESARPTIRASTYATYETMARVHIIPVLGRTSLQSLSAQQVQSLLNSKSESGLSASSVQYIHAVLRRALGQAFKWGLVARNVATLVDPPRGKRNEVQPLTPAQARTFLASVEGDRLEALYKVAVALGMRQGEILGLHWEDVDLDKGSLTVRVTLQRARGKLSMGEPKTARSRRSVALPQVSVAALKAHRVRQIQERLLAGSRWKEEGLVFPTTVGTPINPSNLLRRYKEHLKQAGLPPITFHALRHTCASLLIAQGLPMRSVMEVLGHSQMAMTSDLYGHIYADARREAADRMDDMLSANS